MNITPQNWMSLVADSVELLPASMKAGLRVEPEVLDSRRCPECGDTKIFIATVTPTCASCNVNDLQHFTPVDLSVARPRVSIKMNHHVLASAVLVRLPERVEVVIPEAPSATFRVNSRTPGRLAADLQGQIRKIVVENWASMLGDDSSTAGAAAGEATTLQVSRENKSEAVREGAVHLAVTVCAPGHQPGVKAGRKDGT